MAEDMSTGPHFISVPPSREMMLASRTAIRRSRNAFAKPIAVLLKRNLIHGTVLHHGCGKDTAGSEALRRLALSVTDYDPTYAPNELALNRRYDTVVSNYVLNVLPPKDRQLVILQIANSTYGRAFISVRGAGDHKIVGYPEEDGVRTKLGTFQKGFTFEQLKKELTPYFGEVELIERGDRSATVTVVATRPRQAELPR